MFTYQERGRIVAQAMFEEMEKIASTVSQLRSTIRYGRGVVQRAGEGVPTVAKVPVLGSIFSPGARTAYKAEKQRGKKLIAEGVVGRREQLRKAQAELASAARSGDHAQAEAARRRMADLRGISTKRKGTTQSVEQFQHAQATGKPGEDQGAIGRAVQKAGIGLGVGATAVGGGALYLKHRKKKQQAQYGGY